MHANLLEVFNQRDHAARHAAVARIYAPDILWTDDDGVTRGRDALDSKAVELQAKLGDLQFVVDGPVYQTLGLGLLMRPASDRRGGWPGWVRSLRLAAG